MITNLERAERGALALETVDDAGSEESVTDVLANLMHWCELTDIEFDHALSMARDHYQVESVKTHEFQVLP